MTTKASKPPSTNLKYSGREVAPPLGPTPWSLIYLSSQSINHLILAWDSQERKGLIYKRVYWCLVIQITIMPKKLPLRRGKSYNKIDHERGNSSHSIECLDSCMLSQNFKEKWKTIGSPIAFAGISKIYNYYNKQIVKKEIDHILSTFTTYTKYKEAKK